MRVGDCEGFVSADATIEVTRNQTAQRAHEPADHGLVPLNRRVSRENPLAAEGKQRWRSSTKKLQLIIVEEIIMKAIWNNAVLAQSEDTVVVEGNHYFPPET